MKASIIVGFAILSIVFVLATDQYLFCPVFQFSPPQPFKGDSLYNPYKNVIPGNWIRCNFHAHTHCWGGLTNGCGTDTDIDSVYNSLHYGIHEVSNYEHIDTALPGDTQHINCYEHGYNIMKTHQLVIGASYVCLVDYLLLQTINNKQEILNLLDVDTGAIVALTHPSIREAYMARDFQNFRGIVAWRWKTPQLVSRLMGCRIKCWPAGIYIG